MDTVFQSAAVPVDLEGQILEAVDLGLPAAEPALRALADANPDHASTIVGWIDTLHAVQPASTAPDRFPGHLLLGELGHGGMGVVYLARDERLGRTVALKTLPPPLDREPNRVARFLREARAAALLRHPHICPIHVVGDAAGQPFFTMEHVPGLSLRTLLTRLRALGHAPSALTGEHWHGALFAGAPAQAPTQLWPARHSEITARLLAPIADALAHAHAHGVVHRDVKPDNVMLRFDGTPVLLDFGLAHLDAEGSLTASEDAVGTPHAMAPEQLGNGDPITPATDVWALGVLLYELLTLTLPFPGTIQEAMAGILHREPVPPRQLNPGPPRALEAVCLRCLEKKPAARYASAAAVAADLRAFVELRPLSVQPLGRLARAGRWVRRRPAAAAAIALAGVAAVGIPSTWAVVERQRRHDVETEQGRTRVALHDAQARAAELAFSVGKLAAERGAWEDALSAYEDAERAGYPDAVDLGLRQLDALRGANEVSEFEDLLTQLRAHDPTPAQAARLWLLEGDLLADRGADASAGLDLMRRARATELLPPADAAYADAMLATDLTAAGRDLDRALGHDPTHRSALALRCSILAVRFEWDPLREALARFAAQYPDDPTALVFRYLGTQLVGADPAPLFRDLQGSPMRGPIQSFHRALTALRARAAKVQWSFLVQDNENLAALADEFVLRSMQVSAALIALRQRGFAVSLHPAVARGVPGIMSFFGTVVKAGSSGLRQVLAATATNLLEDLPDAFPDRAALVLRGWARFERGEITAAIADFAHADRQPSLVDIAFGTRLPLDRIGIGTRLTLASHRLSGEVPAAERAQLVEWLASTVTHALRSEALTAGDLGQLAVFAGIAGEATPLLEIVPHWLRARGETVDPIAVAAHYATLGAFVEGLLADQSLVTPEDVPVIVERLHKACGR